MSLSRPVRFPLLKLPFLCIKCVLHNWDDFVLICFATFSKRARRVVKYSRFSMEEINIIANRNRQISIGDATAYTEIRKTWHFKHGRRAVNGEFVLQRGAQRLHTCRGYDYYRGHYLESYTTGATLDALKMGVDIMINVFGCTIEQLKVDGNKISELFGLGISTVKVLHFLDFEPVDKADLKYLLETIKVTDKYIFYTRIPEDFSCDPRIFKSRQMYFPLKGSADWVTLEILCQFDVAQLFFSYHRFSVEDIVSYINYWFNSENRKLEYLNIHFNNRISLEDFEIAHLNPMPFDEKRRNRCPFVGGWKDRDMSSGKDILRKDGLLATFYVNFTSVTFYVWHKRFPDAVQQ